VNRQCDLSPAALAVAGLRDAATAADRLPVAVASCFAVMALVPMVMPSMIGALLGQGAGLAALLVAAHRLWLLGEVQDRAVWDWPPHYLDVLPWLLGMILLFAPALWVGGRDPLLGSVLAAVAGVASLGMMTLLPSLAMGDPAAGYVSCFRQMMPHAPRALLALCLASCPGLALLYAQSQLPKAAAVLDPLARLLLALPLAAISARMRTATDRPRSRNDWPA
jgi:hypothetical protein